MEIREINNKEIWENFLERADEKTFLQSWNWGEFQKMLGEKIWRLGIYDRGVLTGVSLIIKVSARRGRFLFAPHGPLINQKSKIKNQNENSKFKKNILENLLFELKKIAKRENCSFIRVAPIWPRTEENEKIFNDLGFCQAPIHMHPELTWELGLEPSEEQLLAGMRKTTRYLVRQGIKNPDLKIEASENPADIAAFNELYQKTVDRHHFFPFSLEYLTKEFSAFAPDSQILIFSADYRGERIASAMVIFYKGVSYYHQGASSQEYPKVPGSYLLQWEAIKEAKRRGCQRYNFWGIAPNSNPKHPWAGLTLFKTGFGGYEKKYVKTQDLILSFGYWLNFFVERIRKKKRGL